MRVLLLALLAVCARAENAEVLHKVAQCIELPYPGMPRQLWERELVWMKNIGATCVSLPDGPELNAALAFVRKLDLPAWIASDSIGASGLSMQSEEHGGPVRYFGQSAVPQAVCRVSATDARALTTARICLEKHQGTLLWTDVESTSAPVFRRGAISFRGEEQPTLAALRRQVDLFREWQPFLDQLGGEQPVQPSSGKLPATTSARQLFTSDSVPISAVSVVNIGSQEYAGELRVQYPPLKQLIKLPLVTVPAGDALWLPVNLPLAKARQCTNCNGFANDETIVYATAELTRVDYENGTLAMEFCSPKESEVVLHLASEPVGPYLAGGRPRSFDWDASSGRARLTIPAGVGPMHHVRIGLALTEPDTSAFFGDAKILLIGQSNVISTQYSSEAVAARSRLIGPTWLKPVPHSKAPNETDYTITVPETAVHGSHVDLSLEADGTQINHARLQLLLPVTLRFRDGIDRHYGEAADLALDPPLIPVDQRSGRDLTIALRNNAPEIRTFTVEVAGENGLEFANSKAEVVVAASAQRDVVFHLFADHAAPGVHNAHLRVSGDGKAQSDFRILVLPRGKTVRYTDGLFTVWETQRARATFTPDRWVEFVWKDDERNVLPEGGVALGAVRIVELEDALLTTEGGTLPVVSGKQGNTTLTVSPGQGGRITYALSR